jgi:hypothetical protein
MAGRVAAALRNCRPKSPQHEELLAIQFGMNALKALPKKKQGRGDDAEEDADGGGKSNKGSTAKPPKGMSGIEFGLLQRLHEKGEDLTELVSLSFRNSRGDKSAVDETKKLVRAQAESMSMDELNSMLPPNMKSISASFLSLQKSLPFVAEGLLAGFSQKERDKQRKEQEAKWSKEEAAIANDLRSTLVDCVSETVGKDEATVTKADKATDDYTRDTAPPKGNASKSSKSWADWLKGLRANFMKALVNAPRSPAKTASNRVGFAPTPGYRSLPYRTR